eukprot:TRINITY_DN45450_c1_g1_i1.p1 TRINITY_DN45450_c1_g1~~TRINITY_DN45450_c1_g1_i1.p1  ORF type:complete len:280 (-),score=19.28 TRINITY_DN45450_c1_g1_i1:187-942(-)
MDRPRRKKTAAERREQYARADGRRLIHCLRALRSLASHRGCSLGASGAAFLAALERVHTEVNGNLHMPFDELHHADLPSNDNSVPVSAFAGGVWEPLPDDVATHELRPRKGVRFALDPHSGQASQVDQQDHEVRVQSGFACSVDSASRSSSMSCPAELIPHETMLCSLVAGYIDSAILPMFAELRARAPVVAASDREPVRAELFTNFHALLVQHCQPNLPPPSQIVQLSDLEWPTTISSFFTYRLECVLAH